MHSRKGDDQLSAREFVSFSFLLEDQKSNRHVQFTCREEARPPAQLLQKVDLHKSPLNHQSPRTGLDPATELRERTPGQSSQRRGEPATSLNTLRPTEDAPLGAWMIKSILHSLDLGHTHLPLPAVRPGKAHQPSLCRRHTRCCKALILISWIC